MLAIRHDGGMREAHEPADLVTLLLEQANEVVAEEPLQVTPPARAAKWGSVREEL
jgi:hypothetical protein